MIVIGGVTSIQLFTNGDPVGKIRDGMAVILKRSVGTVSVTRSISVSDISTCPRSGQSAHLRLSNKRNQSCRQTGTTNRSCSSALFDPTRPNSIIIE